MNYEKIYNKIIEKRKVEKLSKKEIYCESHHIIPVSFDKSLEKDENNIVNLTAREHYVCHKLLQKIALEKYGKNSHEYMAMTYCMFRMSNNKIYKIKSNDYELYRRKYADYLKEYKSGKNNPNYGKRGILSHSYGKPRSEETKKKMSDNRQKYGVWNKGKKMSDDIKKQMSERMVGRFSGEKHPLYGKPRSEETKRKLSEAHIGKKLSEETKKKMSLNNAGEKNHAFGKKWLYNKDTDEQVYVLSNEFEKYLNEGFIFGMRPKTPFSKETKKKISENKKGEKNPNFGKKWMFNEQTTHRLCVKIEEIEEYTKMGYKLGKNGKGGKSHDKKYRTNV